MVRSRLTPTGKFAMWKERIYYPVFYEPTDRRKAAKPLVRDLRITYASPNLPELRAMVQAVQPHLLPEHTNDIKEILELSKILSHYVECLIVTIGAQGVVIVQSEDNIKNKHIINARHYPANVVKGIKNVSGAGDCFASGFLHGVLSGLKEASCVSVGFTTAKSALLSTNTVPSNFVFDAHAVINAAYYETLL